MNTRLKNYLSCFGPQFISGLSVLAEKSGYERRAFRALTRPLPDFFRLAKQAQPRSKNARSFRAAIWGAIALAWIFMIILLTMARLPFASWLVIAVIVSVIAPRTLIFIASLCLRRAPKTTSA